MRAPVRVVHAFKLYTPDTSAVEQYTIDIIANGEEKFKVTEPKICVTMKFKLLLLAVLGISVKAAPYIPMQQQMMNQVMINQLQDQEMLNQIAQQSMERWIIQNQYNSMQQQLTVMQELQAQKNMLQGPVPVLYNLPPQPIIFLMPNTMTKINHQLEDSNDKDPASLKLGIGDADTVVINAENESNIPEMRIIPRGSVVLLPNGQRLIIGSIISAIPFLPFEVNVPDTISWIYNGISGIIGGIGQRLPFRPKPTTEAPDQQTSSISSEESMNQGLTMQPQETEKPTQESRLKLKQKLMTRKQNVGMPILMLPLAQTVPIQVPMQG